ncbi:MAG: nicotinate (nicotinamide) nucleotide adenylyltransferase [Flavobacteriaceae bacterium]
MKNIGLFFGSFNPIHSGHLAIAEFFAQNPNLEEVWLVVSPQSPFKEKNTLMENHHRLAMVQLAIEDKSNLKACAEEFDLPSPNYTINTLDHLKKKYPQYQFTLLLGHDNIMHFDRWKAYRQILEQFQLYVYPRTQSDKIPASLLNHSNIVYFEASLLNVSATEIRNELKNKKLLADLLPQKIQEYLRKFNLYH